jgi:hypothetical protein
MTGGKHTPGPWSAQANGAQWVIDAGRKQRLASLNTAIVGQEANARLIAAAPDLLDALKQFRTKVYNAALGSGMDDEWATVACSVADAAIAKAEGCAA